jgi:hypothetical protein
MGNFIQITIKPWSVLILFSLVSLGSSATAILKTNSDVYESTVGAEYHDGSTGALNSYGSLFYGMGEDNSYTLSGDFTKKYKDGQVNESYTHDAFVNASAYGTSVQFMLAQGKTDTAYQLEESFAFESFNWNWDFEVLNEDTLVYLLLDPISNINRSWLTLTNISSNVEIFSSSHAEENILLQEGNEYILSLDMTNSANWDGIENLAHVSFSNAIIPVPAPNNTFILLLALIFFIPLRKSLKQFKLR